MEDLVKTAERLRTVKRACEDFLTLWTLQQLSEPPCGVAIADFDENPPRWSGRLSSWNERNDEPDKLAD